MRFKSAFLGEKKSSEVLYYSDSSSGVRGGQRRVLRASRDHDAEPAFCARVLGELGLGIRQGTERYQE